MVLPTMTKAAMNGTGLFDDNPDVDPPSCQLLGPTALVSWPHGCRLHASPDSCFLPGRTSLNGRLRYTLFGVQEAPGEANAAVENMVGLAAAPPGHESFIDHDDASAGYSTCRNKYWVKCLFMDLMS